MNNLNSYDISANNEGQREEWNLCDEEDRGIGLLTWRLSADMRFSDPLDQRPTASPAPLAENTLRRLRNWFAESSGSASNILWLSGIPTSFTLNSITALCEGKALLAASFSFSSRKGSEQGLEVVPSLALQISSNIPALRPIIGLTTSHYPEIFSEPLEVQLEALVFNPFRQYSSLKGHNPAAVLIVDGLELYHDLETQKVLSSSIEMVATTSCIPLRFLLTSREGSQEYGLPLEPGTHLHVHNGSKAPPLLTLQPSSLLNSSPKANSTYYHGFPQPLQTQYSISEAESYTRSLLMLGHGVPLWFPSGNLAAPAEYLQQGPQIGDIMYIAREGIFCCLGNIFRSHEDPINKRMKGQYVPLTLDLSEVTRIHNYFQPGTVITSNGIVAVKQCNAPLAVNFKSNVEEGAVLVLPDGASREDIASTKRLHEYVRRWGPYWYKYHTVPNGSIFIVTGCDKTTDFACATFASNPSHRETLEINMDYVQNETGEHPWNNQGHALAHGNKYPNPETPRFCVFIRGMRIALGAAVWSSYITSPISRGEAAYTNVLHKPPILDRATESLLVRLHCRPREGKALRRLSAESNIFHPIFALGPDLFEKYPKASAVVINDSDWSSLTHQGHGDWTHIKALIDQLYRHYTVVEENGIISLSRKVESDLKHMNTSREVTAPRLFRRKDGPIKITPITKVVHGLGEESDT